MLDQADGAEVFAVSTEYFDDYVQRYERWAADGSASSAQALTVCAQEYASALNSVCYKDGQVLRSRLELRVERDFPRARRTMRTGVDIGELAALVTGLIEGWPAVGPVIRIARLGGHRILAIYCWWDARAEAFG